MWTRRYLRGPLTVERQAFFMVPFLDSVSSIQAIQGPCQARLGCSAIDDLFHHDLRAPREAALRERGNSFRRTCNFF